MTTKPQLELKTASTIKFLRDQGLLTKEHDLLVALIQALTEEWGRATNSTQRSLLSKEIRSAIDMLPKPEVKPTDATQDLLDSLKDVN